jgi:L-threonylcarbamoyladenylate synthase
MSAPVDKAAKVLGDGGVIAYPTEGVFGLGCLPDNRDAIQRVLQIKQRDPAKGLILIAADALQLEDWINLASDVPLPAVDPKKPITWIVPARDKLDRLLRGDNEGIAVRITTNPIARAICNAVNSPIVSTSANLSGQAVANNQNELRRQFEGLVDYIVPGDCGPSSGASEIRILASGEVLRPH